VPWFCSLDSKGGLLCRKNAQIGGLDSGTNIASLRVLHLCGLAVELPHRHSPNGLTENVMLSRPCRKRAVPCATTCAKFRLFSTSHLCFRAGLIQGKSLKKMVSAEGIELSTY